MLRASVRGDSTRETVGRSRVAARERHSAGASRRSEEPATRSAHGPPDRPGVHAPTGGRSLALLAFPHSASGSCGGP